MAGPYRSNVSARETRAQASPAPIRGAGERPASRATTQFCSDTEMQAARTKTDTYEKAYSMLRSMTLIPEEVNPSIEALSEGLLHCAGAVKQANIREYLCAFATYARAISVETSTSNALEKLQAVLEGLATGQDKLDAIDEVVDSQSKLRTQVDGVLGRLSEEVSKLADSNKILDRELERVGGLKSEVEEVLRQAKEAAERMAEVSHSTQSAAPPPSSPMPGGGERLSYAEVILRNRLPIKQVSTLARQEVQARQVLIDVKANAGGLEEDSSEKVLVTKANVTLEMMSREGTVPPDGSRFVSVRKLRHGGLLYEMNSGDAAKWLLRDANMRAFKAKFGPEIEFRARQYTVVFQGVPVGYQPCERSHRELEKENGWKERDLLVTHWIKPVDKRKPNQQTAYLLAKFSNPERANAVILNGLTVWGRKINAWRNLKEARRCNKCHQFGHLAANCTNPQRCGTCGAEDHATTECTEPEGIAWYCVNCKEYGHASWERACPAFIEASRKLQQASTLEQFRFFPIANDPTTWELLPGYEEAREDRPQMTRTESAAARPRAPPATGANTGVHDPPRMRPWGARDQGNKPTNTDSADRPSTQTLGFGDRNGRRQTSLTDGRYSFTQTPRESQRETTLEQPPSSSQSSERVYWADDQ